MRPPARAAARNTAPTGSDARRAPTRADLAPRRPTGRRPQLPRDRAATPAGPLHLTRGPGTPRTARLVATSVVRLRTRGRWGAKWTQEVRGRLERVRGRPSDPPDRARSARVGLASPPVVARPSGARARRPARGVKRVGLASPRRGPGRRARGRRRGGAGTPGIAARRRGARGVGNRSAAVVPGCRGASLPSRHARELPTPPPSARRHARPGRGGRRLDRAGRRRPRLPPHGRRGPGGPPSDLARRGLRGLDVDARAGAGGVRHGGRGRWRAAAHLVGRPHHEADRLDPRGRGAGRQRGRDRRRGATPGPTSSRPTAAPPDACRWARSPISPNAPRAPPCSSRPP